MPKGDVGPPADGLKGVCVLIVEDDWLLANDLASTIDKAGGEVIGPVGQMGEALDLLHHRRPDVAVVDDRLHGETTEQLVAALFMARVPTVVALATAFAPDLPAGVCAADKPVPLSLLLRLATADTAPS